MDKNDNMVKKSVSTNLENALKTLSKPLNPIFKSLNKVQYSKIFEYSPNQLALQAVIANERTWVRFDKLFIKVKDIEEKISEGLPKYNYDFRLNVKEEKLIGLFLNVNIKFLEGMNDLDYIKRVHEIMAGILIQHQRPTEVAIGSNIEPIDIQNILQSAAKARVKKTKPQAPKQLFKDGIDPQPYLNVLKQIDKPLLDQNGDYIGPCKAIDIIKGWVGLLRDRGVINTTTNRETLTQWVKDVLPGLNTTGRTFYKPVKKPDFFLEMKVLINKI